MQTSIDLEKQEKAKEYARIQRRLMVVDLLFGFVYAAAWLGFGWSAVLRGTLQDYTQNPWLLVAGFGLVFGAISLLFDLPLSFYQEYILPHRFDQSTQTLKGWIVDQLKSLPLTVALGGILLEVVYWFLRIAPQTWWLWVGIVLLVFSVLLSTLAPVLLMPLFNKFVPLGQEYAELVERLKSLAARSGVQLEGVYKFDMSKRTKAANAALTGLGRTRRMILGDTLLNEFSLDEVETVMAHELGHQVNGDIPRQIASGSILTLGGLYLAAQVMELGVPFFGLEGVADVAAMPLFILAFGVYELVTMPLGNWLSRRMERHADAFALRLTKKGGAYASALTRLTNQNLAETDPEPWVEALLYSHPTMGKRIRMAQEYDSTHLEDKN